MSNRWVQTPYEYEGQLFGSREPSTTIGRNAVRYVYELLLLGDGGKPLCSIIQNERTETYDVRSFGTVNRNRALVKHPNGGTFKRLQDAVQWCDNNDWSAGMPEEDKTNANGVQLTTDRPGERQHCPACNTDGEHNFTQNISKVDMFKCATCGDEHPRTPIAKRPSTIESNKATMAGQADKSRIPVLGPLLSQAGNGAPAFAQARKAQPLDKIERAAHYNVGNIEVIDVIEDWKLNFNLGSVIKYVGRAPHKGNQIEDLEKARWYITRELMRLEQEAKDEALARPQ